MRYTALAALLAVSVALIIILPSESRLGDSYKLIYFHVPVSIITIATVLLFPFVHLRYPDLIVRVSLTTTAYALVHLILSAVFMYEAWGGIIFSEPKFVFSLVLLFFAITHTTLCFVDLRLARYYSFLAIGIVPYFYMQAASASFQLHPRGVEMPAVLYLPYVLTFPLILLTYLALSGGEAGVQVSTNFYINDNDSMRT